MFTKLMAAVVMTGALWVAGDSLYREFGTCSHGCRAQRTPENCSTGSSCCEVTRSSCCAQAATSQCGNSHFSYCTRTDQIVEGNCCEAVDGRFRCLITGEVSDECCCVPVRD